MYTSDKTQMANQGEASYRNTPVDVKIVLSALWATILFVFAYVDIFGFFRADLLNAAIDGEVANTGLAANQGFFVFALTYILLPSLMVVLSLVLPPRVNRTTNIAVSLFYAVAVLVSCIGETWVYYVIGSAIEAVLLLAIARTAWKWPRA